jgi:hypothetical protein
VCPKQGENQIFKEPQKTQLLFKKAKNNKKTNEK